ncbi:MAG: hypothetical protein JST01_00085 [Cyanobacteria bacterium SZAS TMP-1]|nr:hypothetical protein [Cyanobacteria bacterium SZAS TMP-1]
MNTENQWIVLNHMKTTLPNLLPIFLLSVVLTVSVRSSFASPAFAQASVHDIPPNLTAKEYLLLSAKNVGLGDSEVARECARKAAKLDKEGAIGKRANQFLEANIPRYPVAQTARNQNNEAMGLIMRNKLEPAIALLEDTIADYPKFEWPYYNLACAYLNKKNPKLANDYARKALAINPKYANAWAAMANAYLLERNYLSSKECALKANQYDPENKAAIQILKIIQRVR